MATASKGINPVQHSEGKAASKTRATAKKKPAKKKPARKSSLDGTPSNQCADQVASLA